MSAALASRDGATRIADLIDGYLQDYRGRDTTRLQRLTWWRARLGQSTLADVSDDDVFHALESLAAQPGRYFAGTDADGANIMKAKGKPRAAGTINRYQAALSAVFTWAQRRRYAPKGWQNPCAMVEMRTERNAVVRFLSDEERAALLAACKRSKWSRLYLLVLMALTTGARRGELEALRWRDVDLARAEASVHRSKNGDKKTLILVPSVVEALHQVKGAPDALLFASRVRPDKPFNFNPAWSKALKEAGVRKFRFHDCRHDAASTLARNGATLVEIASVLGHRQITVSHRYAHLANAHKSQLINRVFGGVR